MAGPIRIAVLANGRQAKREINSVSSSVGRLGKLAKSGAAAAGLGGLAYAAGRFAVSAVQAEAKFSTSMRLIQAATKAPSSAMDRLNDKAMRLGQDTAFSASEAADAMLELAKAGLDTRTILQGGVAGTLQLAAAGGTDLATAATIASNALNTFSLKGRDMKTVAAALAGGANASSASVESLGQALQQVGPGATNAGLSLQETVAALSAFDAAGIKGSDAGTSLKTMLTRLVPTTAKAAEAMERLGLDFVKGNGEFESLSTIAQQLKDRLGGLSDAQRIAALSTVFGSDASRAATVLMKEGADGVDKFVKATNDQSAAQKMAEARMGGTAGALEKLSGSIETAKLRLGQELAPAVEYSAELLADKLVPAMDGGLDAAKDLGEAVEPTAKALWELAKLAGRAADFLLDLPGPVKQIGVQAGIAALILPRLTGAVAGVTASMTLSIARMKQLQAEMTYTATRAQAASAAMTRLSGAARAAAGLGGLVALTQASQASNQGLRALGTTAGGALLGFSLGGPLGAAIGAGAGALYGLATATGTAAVEMVDGKAAAAAYAKTLDETTGAATRLSRALVLDQITNRMGDSMTIVNQSLRELGLSTRDMVGYVLGEEAATQRLNGAIRRNANSRNEAARLAAEQLRIQRDFLNGDREEAAQIERTTRRRTQSLATWRESLTGMPKAVRVELKQLGYAPNLKQIKTLSRQYELTPKQVRTLIRLTGAGKAQADAKGTKKSLEDVGKVKPNLRPFVAFYSAGLNDLSKRARGGVDKINKNLKDGTSKARPDLGPFQRFFVSGIDQTRGQASRGGNSIGNALQQGVVDGFAGTASILAGQAAGAVSAAVAAARREAQIKSPSRKMRLVGELMGAGLVDGLTRQQRAAEEAGRRLTASTVRGATASYTPGVSALDTYRSSRATPNHRKRQAEPNHRKRVVVQIGAREFEGYMAEIAAAEIDTDRRFDRVVRGA